MSCEHKCGYSTVDGILLILIFLMIMFGGCNNDIPRIKSETERIGQTLGEVQSLKAELSKEMEQIRANQKLIYDILASINNTTNRMALTNVYLEERH